LVVLRFLKLRRTVSAPFRVDLTVDYIETQVTVLQRNRTGGPGSPARAWQLL